MRKDPFVLVLESGDEAGRRLLHRIRGAGLLGVEVRTGADVMTALGRLPTPDVAWIGRGADPAAVSAAREAGLPAVFADEGGGCPLALLRAGVTDAVGADEPPAVVAAVLREAEARRRARVLEECWRQAALDAGAAMLLVSPDGAVLDVNGALARLAGGPLPDAAGMPLAAVVRVEAPEAGALFAEALRSGGTWAGDVRLAAGGRQIACTASLAPLTGARCGAAGSVLVLVDASAARAREAALVAANERLSGQVWIDHLTQVHNRGYFHHVLDREFARALRYRQPLSLLMADEDRFKDVNDSLGHLFGDEVLRRVAEAIRMALRMGDEFSRYGGDEFCALLPQTTLEEAESVARRVREVVQGIRLSVPGAPSVHVTVGCACTSELPDGAGPLDLVDLADRRLRGTKPAR